MRTRSLGLVIACLATTTTVATADPVSWKKVTFSLENTKSHEPGLTIEAFPDGRVVFSYGSGLYAPSIAHALPALVTKVGEWAKHGPNVADKAAAGEYVMHVRLSSAKETEAVYATDKLPAEEGELYKQLGALINSKREAVPCVKWDGKGDFTLSTWSEDFGVAPGPIHRDTIQRNGTIERALDGKVTKTTKATTADLAAIRSALITVDLGQFTQTFGGAGEGSNIRTITLVTGKETCSRSFTNKWDAKLKPLEDALAPVTKGL